MYSGIFSLSRAAHIIAVVALLRWCMACIDTDSLCRAQSPNTPMRHALLPPSHFRVGSGEVLIDLEPSVVARGESFLVRAKVRFRDTSTPVYNPFLSEAFISPAVIIATSADGMRRFTLLKSEKRSGNRLGKNEPWVFLGGISSAGRQFCIHLDNTLASKTDTDSGCIHVDMPPGEYYLQAIYNHWLFAHWSNAPGYAGPDSGSSDEPKARLGMSERRMREPIGVSPAVKLVVKESSSRKIEKALATSPISVQLELDKSRAVNGDRAVAKVSFISYSSGPLDLFAPYHDGHLGTFNGAIKLVILKNDGTLLGDIWSGSGASYTGPARRHWIRLPSGGIASTAFSFVAGKIPESSQTPFTDLPAGEYKLQLRLHKHFIQGCPLNLPFGGGNIEEAMTFDEWVRTFPGPEFVRTELKSFEILSSNRE